MKNPFVAGPSVADILTPPRKSPLRDGVYPISLAPRVTWPGGTPSDCSDWERLGKAPYRGSRPVGRPRSSILLPAGGGSNQTDSSRAITADGTRPNRLPWKRLARPWLSRPWRRTCRRKEGRHLLLWLGPHLDSPDLTQALAGGRRFKARSVSTNGPTWCPHAAEVKSILGTYREARSSSFQLLSSIVAAS
jgi:hypothetical protein